jgi:hypothetical protein
MEKLYTNTRFRIVNGWLELERSDDNFDTKSLTHIKMDCISHLSREGPLGDYDDNDEPIQIWHVDIHMCRSSAGKLIKHKITFAFQDLSDAETFLIGINSKMY